MRYLRVLTISLLSLWTVWANIIYLTGLSYWVWLICVTPTTLLLLIWTDVNVKYDRQDRLIAITRKRQAQDDAKQQKELAAQQIALACLDQIIARIGER